MIAAQYALGVWGFSRVVLVGCPMDGEYEGYLPAWRLLSKARGARIRSMSGNTAQIFGFPDAQFLGGA